MDIDWKEIRREEEQRIERRKKIEKQRAEEENEMEIMMQVVGSTKILNHNVDENITDSPVVVMAKTVTGTRESFLVLTNANIVQSPYPTHLKVNQKGGTGVII